MSLPDSNTIWPPKPFDDLIASIAEQQVWWEGIPEGLANYYGQGQARRKSAGFDLGGIGVKVFWGKKDTQQHVTSRLHLPIPADICATSANLLFADGPKFLIPDLTTTPEATDENPEPEPVVDPVKRAAQDRVDRILNTPNMHAAFLVAAETCAALGGVWPRIVWDGELTKNAFIDFVDPDRAIPEFKWGRLQAVTFWSELPSTDKAVWRHLERYEAGKIWHGLYKGTDDHLGRVMALDDHAATAKIKLGSFGFIATGSDSIAAGYIPNQLPNPAWRLVPALRHLGRSDISDDLLGLFDQIDEAYSSLMRDLRLGRARAFVSENFTKVGKAGQGASVDNDRELYQILANAPGKDGTSSGFFEVKQFEIRVEEHLQIIDALTREVLRRVGYSPLTFGLSEGNSAATATEITAKTTASNSTRTAKHRLWGNTLTRLSRTLLEIDAAQFKTGVKVDEDLQIQWPPVRESAYNRSLTAKALREAKAASTETIVALVNPDWDAEAVQTETERILNEDRMTFADPFGMPPDQNPNDTSDPSESGGSEIEVGDDKE
ncbi:phage portal protein [Rhodococcus sp. NPDC056506]|uniref:phage portal protein n=1 Tax=Rhodococcus sp. NPDC056506 TaxID=3345844 RepID=UPI0036701D93